MGNPFHTTLLYKPSARRHQKYPFARIEAKTGLVTHIEDVKIPTYINNITCVLQHTRYYTYKRSLTRVN